MHFPIPIAVTIVVTLAAQALAVEIGPLPRELCFDRNGYPLPQGAVARLGVPAQLNGISSDIAWTLDGKQFIVADWQSISTFDAVTGRLIETKMIDTAIRGNFATLARDGRLLFRLSGSACFLNDVETGTPVLLFSLPPPLDRKRGTEPTIGSLNLSANLRFLVGVLSQGLAPGVPWRYDLAKKDYARIADRNDVNSVRLAPNGRRAFGLTGQTPARLVCWDLVTGKELWSAELDVAGIVQAVSSDNRRLAVIASGNVRVFDAEIGKELLAVPYEPAAYLSLRPIDFSEDGRRLAVSGAREAAIWDVETAKIQHRFPHPARMVAFSSDGKSLLTASTRVQRWDVETGLPTFPTAHLSRPVVAMKPIWSQDGRRVLTHSLGDRGTEHGNSQQPHVLSIWDVTTMRNVWTETCPPTFSVDASLDGNGTTVRAWTGNNRLTAWSIDNPSAKAVVTDTAPTKPPSSQCLRFLSDGRFAVVRIARQQAASIDLIDATGAIVTRYEYALPKPTAGKEENFGWVHHTAILGSKGSRFDLLTRRALPTLQLDGPEYTCGGQPFPSTPAFVPSYSTIRGRSNLQLWESCSGRVIAGLPSPWFGNCQPALSADGRFLALPTVSDVIIHDLSDRRITHRIPAGVPTAMSFSPNGRLIATAQPEGITLIWSVPRVVREWSHSDVNRQYEVLGSTDPSPAWKALWHLVDHPDRATEVLKARLRPVPVQKDADVQITRLDDAKFVVREVASKELARRGDSVEGDLLSALKATKSEEQRKRLEQLLAKLDPTVPPTGDILRSLRCVWLLEHIGTTDAKKLLESLATGATGSRVTVEAKAAIERLAASR